MKVFTLEFHAFNQVHWKNVDYEITAQSLEELETAVKNELQWCELKVSLQEKWESLLPHVHEGVLVFPIVHKSIWSN